MQCRVDTRNQARAAIETIDAYPAVVATTLLEPGEDATNGWTIEIVCDRPVPPAVLRSLGGHGLQLRDVSAQGVPAHYVLTATV
jgi:hypothetical protein